MQTTTNYGLKKPELNEFYHVEDFNYNADVLDAKLKEVEDASNPKVLSDHIADTTAHVTSAEKASWNAKAGGTHKHTKSEITDFPTSMKPTDHSQSASTITAGTVQGVIVANPSAVSALGTKQMRNIYGGTEELTDGVSALPAGDIYVMFEEA
jgi:hypothetical protein